MRMLSLLNIAEQMIRLLISSLNPLYEARFIKLHTMLGIQEDAIMGGCHDDIISPPESPETCVDRGVLEHQVMMVHHTSPRISWSSNQPTSGNSRSSDQPDLYISRSSSRQVCRLEN
jgi:hypothetical protein